MRTKREAVCVSFTKEEADRLKEVAKDMEISVQDVIRDACTPATQDCNKGLRWYRVAMAPETHALARKLRSEELIEDLLDSVLHEALERELKAGE
jgi:hypothetical protein